MPKMTMKVRYFGEKKMKKRKSFLMRMKNFLRMMRSLMKTPMRSLTKKKKMNFMKMKENSRKKNLMKKCPVLICPMLHLKWGTPSHCTVRHLH